MKYKREEQDSEAHDGADKPGKESLLSVLGDLFVQIATSRRKYGVIHPKKFITKVKKENSE